MTETEQRELNRLCTQLGLQLFQHGAESALVESVVRRAGLVLGAHAVEVAIMANAITVTVVDGKSCVTTVRRSEDRGINMHIVMETQRVMLDLEAGRLDLEGAFRRVAEIQPFRYPRWMVVIAIGLSCACFARLAHADLVGCVLTFFASAVAMAVRQGLATFHFSPLVNFFVSACVATSVAAQGLIYGWGTTPKIAMAASCLLLVPGVPLINSVSDMVKGYVNTGIARWTMATLLALATCGGIVLAMTLWKVWAWL